MMKDYVRIPKGVWGWQGTALVVLVVALPPAATLQLEPQSRSWADTAAIVGLVVYPIMLVSALMLYFSWRLSGDSERAWISAAFTAIAVKGFSLAGLRAAYGTGLESQATALMIVDLVFALSIVTMLTLGATRAPRVDPVVIGLVLGGGVSVLRLGLMAMEPLTAENTPFLGAASALLLGIHITFAYAVFQIVTTPAWARTRLSAAVLLLGVNRAISYPSLESDVVSVVALLTDALGAILLATTALGLLRLAIGDQTREVHDLSERVGEVEELVRQDRERLHEINATIAGIATASRLINDDDGIAPDRRGQLQQMVEAEIARLERLVGNRSSSLRDVNLDEALQPVVVSRRVLGQTVDWTPSGCRAVGRADDIAEVVTTLLNNSAQHAPGSPVSLAVHDVDGAIEIHVRDHGPGISRELAARLFEWGQRGPSSRGQGIGLSVAQRLVKQLGGTLRVRHTTEQGAHFVISLQPSRSNHGAASARA